jgi:hypothetical protein
MLHAENVGWAWGRGYSQVTFVTLEGLYTYNTSGPPGSYSTAIIQSQIRLIIGTTPDFCESIATLNSTAISATTFCDHRTLCLRPAPLGRSLGAEYASSSVSSVPIGTLPCVV